MPMALAMGDKAWRKLLASMTSGPKPMKAKAMKIQKDKGAKAKAAKLMKGKGAKAKAMKGKEAAKPMKTKAATPMKTKATAPDQGKADEGEGTHELLGVDDEVHDDDNRDNSEVDHNPGVDDEVDDEYDDYESSVGGGCCSFGDFILINEFD